MQHQASRIVGPMPNEQQVSEALGESSGDACHLPLRELPEVLTLREVAEALRCSKAHVCKIVNGQVAGAPRIPAITLGRRKLVRRESLLRWIEENEKAGTIPASPERGTKTLSEKRRA
jgi:hypothetical protein